MVNYSKKLVNKPWGSEYLLYQNKGLAAWLLKIKPGHKTSFHCHPKKKTGFIILDGKVELRMGFYEKKKLKAVDKIMIRPGLFHETKAISKNSATVIELETPNKKEDLIRYRDDYGREEKRYEGKSNFSELDKNTFIINENHNKTSYFKMNKINFKLSRYKQLKKRDFKSKNEIHAILDGGLGKNKNQLVLCRGDIVRSDTMQKLMTSFKPCNSLLVLTIVK